MFQDNSLKFFGQNTGNLLQESQIVVTFEYLENQNLFLNYKAQKIALYLLVKKESFLKIL
jgi:hypothetical protein